MTLGSARASRAQLRALAKLPRMNSLYFLFAKAPNSARDGVRLPRQ
jgi:hypothetical protein